jgi:protein-tyrosine-phosphatase/predicted ATP-grasp superfamily ATP-dependent carboligase
MHGFFDKARTRDLAAACGVPMAPGRLLTRDDTAQELVARFGLPLFIKPRRSYEMARPDRRAKVIACRTLESVERALGSIERRDDFLVEGNQPGSGLGLSVLCHRGTITQALQHRRVREPVDGGGSGYRRTEAVSDDLFGMVQAMCRATALDGVAMFEFKHDERTGRCALIEVNARFWGSLPLAVAAGVDFPHLLYRQMVEGSIAPRASYRVPWFARNLSADIEQFSEHLEARRKQGTWPAISEAAGWLFSFGRVLLMRESHDAFAWDDPAPALAEYAAFSRRLASRVVGRSVTWRRLKGARALGVAAGALARVGREGRKPRILVLCYGNICRSPYAAAVLRDRLLARGVAAEVPSAGLAHLPGRPSPAEAVKVARERGQDLSAHRSAFASDHDLGSADLILVFDKANLAMLEARGVDLRRPAIRMGEFAVAPDSPVDIADPVDGDEAVFAAAYARIDRACERLAAEVERRS